MIAYLEGQDTTVEVPDDIGEKELSDLQRNFSANVAPPEEKGQPAPNQATQPVEKWKPDFYQSFIHPLLPSLGIAALPAQLTETPQTRAFTGKAIEEFTFGLTKPITPEFLKQEYKDHPVFAATGQMAGGIGSLLATGNLLKLTRLPFLAAEVGAAGAKVVAAAPRFVAPAIMTGATFGTKRFITETVRSLQEGQVDIGDFGSSVVKDTALGMMMGGISGISNTGTAITSAAGLGFLSSKMDGGDNAEAVLNAGIWGIFEAVGSFGREARLRKDALNTLGDTIGEYVAAKNPNIPPAAAKDIGARIVAQEAEKVGGIDAIVKSDKEGTLGLIEGINQKIRQGKIRETTTPTTPTEPLQITNQRPEPVNVTETTSPAPFVAPEAIPGQTTPQPIEPVLPVPPGISAESAVLREKVFPPTEVTSSPSIAQHPDFIKLSDDATAIVNHWAKVRGVEPTAGMGQKLYQEFHDTLGRIMHAPPEQRLEIAKQIKAEFPDIEKEFTTLRDKVWSDTSDNFFTKQIAGKYGVMRPKVAIDAENVPHGDLRKQSVASGNEDIVQMWKNRVDETGAGLPSLPERVYADLAKIASLKPGTAATNELPRLYSRLREAGQTDQEALRAVREYFESGSPSRLQQALGSDMALPSLSPSTPQTVEPPFTLKPDIAALQQGVKKEAKPVKLDKKGIPIRKPGSVVTQIQTPLGETAKITHEMILSEAEGILDSAKTQREGTDSLAQFVLQNGGLKAFKADETGRVPEAEEMRSVPVRFKNERGLPADEMADMAFEAGLLPESSADLLRERLKSIPKKGTLPKLGELYNQALRNLEEYFSTFEPTSPEVEVEPGVFFETAASLFETPKENLSDRYERLRQQAINQGMTPGQAAKYAKDQLRAQPAAPTESKAKQQEFSQGGVEGFGQGRQGEQELFFEKSPGGGETLKSTRAGARQFGDEKDQIAALKKSLGGLQYIKKMKGPELVKFFRTLAGHVPSIQRLTRALGYFRWPSEKIALAPDIFKDQQLWEAVLAHEIGHFMDYQPDKTMNRGNILGRMASLREYRKSLLPESPESTEQILTDKDRARFRREAEKMAKGKDLKQEPDNQFDPQMILNVWNSITSDVDKNLLDYIKGIDVEQKKSLIKAAMQALKKGEKITVFDVKKFNADAGKDLKRVSDIYKDLLKKEIKKRKLWENEVISKELKDLTQFWKPFNPTLNSNFTKYRYSSPELYADFVSVLLNAPAKAKEIAPNAYEAFFNYLQNKPEVMTNLIEMQSLIQSDDADLQKVRGDDILKMFERGEDAYRYRQKNLEAAQKSTWDKLRVYFWDKNAILLDEVEKLKKQGEIGLATDAQYAIEKNSMMSVFVKSFLDDFDRLIYKPAKQEGILDDLKTVLFLDRVGEDRAELANPLGHTPESAQALMKKMKEDDPARFEKVSALADQARQWFKSLSALPGSEDFFTSEQLFTIGQSEKYAPFRVTKYLRDYLSAGMSAQMGTLEDINDPLTSLAMKGVSLSTAIERNRLKKVIGEMLLRSGIEMRPAKVTQFPGTFKIENAPENHLGTMSWKSGGKWVAYHLDKYIADLFDHAASEKIGQIGATLNMIFQNNFFRKLWITFSPTFQSVNLIRDFMRTWKNTPGLTIGRALRLYLDSIPQAKARALGNYDPLIQQMERSGALQLTLNDLILGQTGEDKELENMLQKFDIIESPENKYKNIPVIKQITDILDWLRYVGDTIETLPKIVGWKALDNMGKQERANFVANFVGTPNPKRSGTAAPIVGSILLFANIFKEGFRGLIEIAFKNPKTRRSYWTKTMESAILPKILMAIAGAGFFGAGIKSVMDKASEYHKTNYLVIPIGVDEQGNGIYITLPQDEDARLIGGIFWKLLNHNGNVLKNLSDILSFGVDQFPGVAPSLLMGKAWAEFLSGGNPRDTFRQQNILTDQERAAGGMYAFEPMARWTFNETGLVRLDIRDRLKTEPVYKTVISSIPILQRFLRVGRQGERELAREAGKEVKSQAARTSIDIKEAARQAIRKGVSLEDFTANAQTIPEAQKLRRAYNELNKNFTEDPFVQALNSATSSDEKLAILKEIRGTFTDSNEYNDYLDTLYLKKIIPPRVALEARE